MSKIVVLKLISGEELLAKEESDGTYSKVRVFQINGQSAGLIPWLLLSPDQTNVDITFGVMAKINAPLEIEKQYLSATSSIQLLS
jgi:hypothetical protein